MKRRYNFPQEDFSSRAGATLLAQMIESYWRGRGFYKIRVTVADQSAGIRTTNNMATWPLVSNIGPTGFPPR